MSKPEFGFLRELAHSITDVNKEVDEEEQEQHLSTPHSLASSKNGTNVAGSSSTSTNQAGGVPKRGRPRKRPLEEDVHQPIDYRKVSLSKTSHKPHPQSSTSSSAAALAAVSGLYVPPTRPVTNNQQSIIHNHQPGTSKSSRETDDDETEEEDGDEDDDDEMDEDDECGDEDEDEAGRSAKSCIEPATRPMATSSASMLPASSAPATEIDDDYDN